MSSLQDHQWLVEHHSEAEAYAGRWIAILDGGIIASGKNFHETHGKAIRRHPGTLPLVLYILKKSEELLIF